MHDLQARHNVRITGGGDTTLLFVHGLGCDQTMWRFVAPAFERRARVVCMDLVGFGRSRHADWTPGCYDGLDGHAHDVAAVARAYGGGRCIVVGHSVSAMIGLLADLQAPEAFLAHAMVAPSPCYLNEPGYPGGFDRAVLDETLAVLAADSRAWTQAMLPMLLSNAPDHPNTDELFASFCRAHPQALLQLARATFLSDLRPLLPQLAKPVLVVQSDDDLVAPFKVGLHMAATLRDCTLRVIANQGHCPHLTSPGACTAALSTFLDSLDVERELLSML